MNLLRAAAILLAAITPAALQAQWAAWPTPGVPKNADGKLNLTGPAPRTADGHPDLSGVWQNFRGNGNGQGEAGFAPPREGAPPAPTFRDAGANFKDGLPLQSWAKELIAARRSENSKYNPDALCLPMGFMQFHMHPQPRKIIQTPGVTVIVYEANSGLRQIFTDGRALPKGDLQPWWYGYSVGKWDGDTLVVETTGFRDDVWLDIIGSPMTSAAKVTERFRRPTFGNLEIDITVDDPKVYTKPWSVRVAQRIMPDAELIEFICAENDTSPAHMVGK